MKNIFKKSMGAITLFSLVLTAASLFLAAPISKIYVGYDGELFNLTVYAFRMFSTSYLIIGFNIFGSAFFTALNNGAISAAISFLRTLLFQIRFACGVRQKRNLAFNHRCRGSYIDDNRRISHRQQKKISLCLENYRCA